MRPLLISSALVLSLAALPALAQTAAPADRYGPSAARPATPSAVGGGAGMLSWAGKTQAGAVSRPSGQAPQPLPNGLLASTSIARSAAPIGPQPAAPPAPPAPRIASAAPLALPAPVAPVAPSLNADGLLGAPPPVRERQVAAGAL